MSLNRHSFTIPDFFSKRFGDEKRILTLIAAIVIVVFFIPYTASGFAACGKLFSSLFGFNYLTAMIISAIVIVAYCTLGGFLAASMTDLIQSIVMTIALVVVVVYGVNVAGGFDMVMGKIPKHFQDILDYLIHIQQRLIQQSLTACLKLHLC